MDFMTQTDLRNKRITVIGLGNSGFNAANLLIDVGAAVWATDAGSLESTREYASSLKARGARVGRNPRTGAHVSVDEKVVPFFKTGKELRDRLNNKA